MPKYNIKRGNTIIASVTGEGSQNVEAMGVNDVTMKFTLVTPVVFQVGDWCSVYGNKYIVYRKPEYTKVNERQHEYDLYLVHEFYKLQDSILMGLDKNATLNEKQFYLTGNLQSFADLVLLNANRNDSGWTLGTIDVTGAKTLQFDGENILASLNRIANEFETEFWVEGKTISFTKRLQNSGITLSYGENKGLISISKGNKDANATIFTRLFVEGSERNLPSYTNYGYKRLQLPSANNGKVDNASAIAQFGVIEKYVKFDDVFPQHTGTVTAVGDEFTFYDTNLPFDVNAQLLPGVTAYVAFQSGVLAGYNFDISSFDNATKKFTILENEDEKTVTLPNATLKPAVGDTYIIFDIQMPQTHITAAENELLTKANELLAQGSDIDFNDAFTGVCDPLYFKRNTITPVLGQYVRLYETNPAIDVTKRMSKISRDLQNEWKYDITFTDKIQVNTVVREYIKNIEETLVINETVDRTIINHDAVRRAAQRIDILRDDVFDPDGYFDGTHLKPETIEAIMATFGYKSGNMALEGVAFSLNVGANPNNFNITAGKLIHFSYDIGGAYVWDMGSMTSSFTDSASGYYIYAKISKTALTGAWVVNNQKLQVDNEAGYYTLLIGRVYPVVNGKREIDLLYGVTNIVGNRIQTGIIQDLAGNNYWNLDTGQMRITGSVTIVGTDSNVYTKPETDAVAGNKNFTAAPLEYKVGDTWTLQADLLLNGIQYKAGDVLTTLTTSATFVSVHWAKRDRYVGLDDVKLGGTNLLTNSANPWMSPNYAGLGTSVLMLNEADKYYRATPDADKVVSLFGVPYTYEAGKDYIASIYVRHSHSAAVDILVMCYKGGLVYGQKITTLQPNTWAQVTTNSFQEASGEVVLIIYCYTPDVALDYKKAQVELGNKASDWSPSLADVNAQIEQAKTDATTASNTYAAAQALAAENAAKAHADGVVDAEEQARIDADNNYLQAAKNYADAEDAALKVLTDAYADGVATDAESAAIAVANAYADVKKTEANAYADGIVNAEEAARIADANAKLQQAKDHAALLDSQIKLGGVNLFRKSDIAWATTGNEYLLAALSEHLSEVFSKGEITISFDIKLAAVTDGNVLVFSSNNAPKYEWSAQVTGVTTEWKRMSVTVTPYIINPAGTTSNIEFYAIYGTWQIPSVRNIRIDSGSKAFDYAPNPDDINDELASFSNDGILKPVEKSGLKTLMDDIAKAHAALLTRAANYPSVSTTLLASNYSTLTSYINPLLASMTTDSTIVRTTFDSYFSNYFTQRKTVEENIEAANKTNTDAKITFFTGGAPSWGAYKINDLWKPSPTQILDGTTFYAGEIYRCTNLATQFGQNWKVDKSVSSGTTLPPTNTAKLSDLFIHEGDSNRVYQFNGTSWVVKADTRIQTALENANAAQNAAASKTRIITSTTAPSGTADVGTIWQRTYTSDGKVYIKYYRYDGTAWNETSGLTSASYLEQAIAGLTEVSGGLSLGHVFAVRNSLGQVTGYINGQDGNPYGAGIMLAAGVNNFGLSNETQNIFLKHDGSAKIGKMTVDVNGNITGNDVVFNNGTFNNGTFNGTINSINGVIGALNINTSGLFVDSNAPADSLKDKFYLKRVGNNIEFKIYNESLTPLYDGNQNVIGYFGSNKGMSYTPATGLVINSSNHVLGSYSTNEIAIRVLSGHLYFDRLYDSGSTVAYGRVRWKYDVDGDKVLFIDGSNL